MVKAKSRKATQYLGEVVTSAYLGNNQANVGGYSVRQKVIGRKTDVRGIADFVDNKEVLNIAKDNDLKWVHLAGDWSNLGEKGYGQRVLIKKARKLLELKKVM